MVIEDDMEDFEVFVGATAMSMHERFSMLAATSPFLGAAPRRARRPSMNEGPLLNFNRNQHNVGEEFRQLRSDYETQGPQQNRNWRSGSQPRSRAGSVSRGSEASFGLRRSNSWGNLSRASSVGNVSHHSARSRRSNGRYSNRSVAMTRQPRLDLSHRLQMRDAWMRGRRGRSRGHWYNNRGRGGYVQRGRIERRNWTQIPWTRRRGKQQNGGQYRGTQYRGRGTQYRGRGTQYGGNGGRGTQYGGRGTQNGGHFIMTRSRAKQNEFNFKGWTNNTDNGLSNNGSNRNGMNAGGSTGRGRRGRGRGRGRGGVSQNSMPPLLTLEQLDRELDEYMASTPAVLDKQIDEYMAQNGMEVELLQLV